MSTAVGPALLEALECLEPRRAGHVLVEKDHVYNAVLLQGFEQGAPSVKPVTSYPLRSRKRMCGEQVDLIVGPKDVRGARHGSFKGNSSQFL